MKIQRIISQHRRDFMAIFECEHCGHTKEQRGYDDAYYHNSVIPKMKCEKCGKMTGGDYQPVPTKYPEGIQV